MTLQIFWAKPGNPREGGRVERSNEWRGRSREGEARAKPGNQLVLNRRTIPIINCMNNINKWTDLTNTEIVRTSEDRDENVAWNFPP